MNSAECARHIRGAELCVSVARKHGLSPEELLAPLPRGYPTKRAEAVRELYGLLRREGWSYPQIGRFVGRHHTTVMQVLLGRRDRKEPAFTLRRATANLTRLFLANGGVVDE
jgi:hypothetical protein